VRPLGPVVRPGVPGVPGCEGASGTLTTMVTPATMAPLIRGGVSGGLDDVFSATMFAVVVAIAIVGMCWVDVETQRARKRGRPDRRKGRTRSATGRGRVTARSAWPPPDIRDLDALQPLELRAAARRPVLAEARPPQRPTTPRATSARVASAPRRTRRVAPVPAREGSPRARRTPTPGRVLDELAWRPPDGRPMTPGGWRRGLLQLPAPPRAH
jgi:hypothetical protein